MPFMTKRHVHSNGVRKYADIHKSFGEMSSCAVCGYDYPYSELHLALQVGKKVYICDKCVKVMTDAKKETNNKSKNV